MPFPHPDVAILDQAQAIKPLVTNEPNQRSPEALLAVVDQLCVSVNPRYKPILFGEKKTTYCNIAVWDATRAMNAELPHWVFPDGTIALPFAKGAGELNCNRLVGWLHAYGDHYDWRQLDREDQARARADQGFPTVAIWKNPTGGPGHIGMIMPSPAGGPTLLTQAGATCFELQPFSHGFSSGIHGVEFWTHP